jgi:5-formyltetrahydrofolate cyclo-ligase
MNKTELRRLFLEKRKSLSDDEARAVSRQLAGRFVHTFSLQPGACLHVYLPLLRQREIDTFLLVEQVRVFFPRVRIVVPKADAATLRMESYLLDETTELAPGAWGIPEPAGGELVPPEAIDWVVVPLLACDRRGYRVGYGKGFYDRYLARCRPGVRKIGLSYFDPVPAITDAGPFDVRLDYCLAPGRVWEFPEAPIPL